MIDKFCPKCNKRLGDKNSKMCARCCKLKELNPMWKGDRVGYASLHEWIKNKLKKNNRCNICDQKKPLDLANISGMYKRNFDDWEWLCRKCHMEKDGRLEKLKISRIGIEPWNKGKVFHKPTCKNQEGR